MSTDLVQSNAFPSPIPPPANFPVRWEDPADERLFWAVDLYHAPEPLKMLDYALFGAMWPAGNRAYDAFGIPVHAAFRRINGYVYATEWPTIDAPDELESEARRSQENLERAMGGPEETWRTQYVPELEGHLAFWESFDRAGASMSGLLDHLDETLARWERIWGEIHLMICWPAFAAVTTFDDFYREIFGSADAFAAHLLLQGFGSKTVEVGHALWRLSRLALSRPEVSRVLNKVAASEVIAALEQSDAGRDFLSELRAYLHEYGRRSDRLEASHPSWREDPTPVLKNLKDYVAQPNRDLAAEQAGLAAGRERAIAEARARLRDYPQEVRDRFEILLRAAQVGHMLNDDHQYWIDFASLYDVRQVLLEFGRRFAAAGIIDRPEDVFHLTLPELRETATAMPRIDRRMLVGARAAEVAYFRTIAPPPFLGTPPTTALPDTPFLTGWVKYYGTPPSTVEGMDPQTVVGNAGSPGKARGVARVARVLGEAGKLRPGEVLVAAATSPSWTPLFGTAAAIVTDTGGILSHAAVVAREYGIPAVVATGNGTERIRDGQLLEVDGDAGLVRIIPPPAE